MLNKKLMILIIIFVSLLTVSAVSAEDNATSDVVGANNVIDDVSAIDDTETDIVTVEENDELLNVEENQVILEENDVGTFDELSILIKNTAQGGTLELDKDYKFNSTVDSDYKDGVAINKRIILNGNGHSIDGNNLAKILTVSSRNVIIKNVIFKNIYSSSANTHAAIFAGITYSNCVIENCSFIGINVKYGESAIEWHGDNLTVKNCNFYNNYANNGRIVIFYANNVNVTQCTFINNSGAKGIIDFSIFADNGHLTNCEFINNIPSNSAVVNWAGDEGIMNNCSFVENIASQSSTVYWSGAQGIVANSSFINNSAYLGGAIYLESMESILKNCSFINNDASSYGGAIYSKGDESCFSDSIFVNNTAAYGGCVYLVGGKNQLYNSSFIDNSASNDGGAIYWLSNYGTLFNCSFIQNSASSDNEGGAIRWNGNYGNISDCYFDNNLAYGGSAISLYGANSSLSNCLFINNFGYGAAGAVYCNANECAITNCSFVNNSASLLAGAVFLSKNNIIIENCLFVNNSANDGGAIIIREDLNSLINCIFENNNASRYGGSIYLINNDCYLYNCTFSNSFADYGGAIFIQGIVNIINSCSFINDSASTWGGSIYWMGSDGLLVNNSFSNNSAINGGAIFWRGDYGTLFNCVFEDNLASENGSSIYWYGNNGNLTESIVIDNSGSNQVYWFNNENGNIAGCEFINNTNSVINNGANFIRNKVNLTYSNSSFDFKSPKVNSVYLINVLDKFPIKSQIIFNFIKDDDFKNFTIDLKNNSASICDELFDLEAGNWEVIAIFAGDSNYGPCNTTFSITISPILSSLILKVSNTTVGHKTMLISNVSSLINSTVDDGVVTFYDNGLEIGSDYVVDGVATLTYVPTTDGEHTITAIYNSNNYISSNNAAELLVDSASVEVLVENGTVGFNNNFIANVKGLYSCINEGSVIFYINNAYIGKVPVVDGFAGFNYTPLSANTFVIKAVYCDSEKFRNAENTSEYIVNKADSKIIIDDINATVGHDIIIKANIFSSNNLTINEGIISFSDNNNEIGAVFVKNGVASLSYTPRTAGEHKITAAYFADNYQSSDASYNIIVNKESTELVFNDISTVEYQIASGFLVNIKSGSNIVQEGKVKFYINNSEIGYKYVENGVASFDYVSPSAGSFDIVAIFEETENYLASNATSTFTVEKLPTTISASAVTTVYNGGKYLTATLKDSYGNPLSRMKLTIVLNGKTSTPTTDVNGQVKVSTNGLAPKAYYPTITFDGNSNYDQATKSVKVTVKKATPKLTAKAKTFKKSVKTKKYTVTLKTNKNKVMKKVWVSLNVNKKTYKIKTNNKGQATFKITNLKKKGKYTAVVKYAGSKYYNAKTVKPKITIK